MTYPPLSCESQLTSHQEASYGQQYLCPAIYCIPVVVGLWQGSGCWLVWLGWAGDEALAFPKEKGWGRSSSDTALANPKEKGRASSDYPLAPLQGKGQGRASGHEPLALPLDSFLAFLNDNPRARPKSEGQGRTTTIRAIRALPKNKQ